MPDLSSKAISRSFFAGRGSFVRVWLCMLVKKKALTGENCVSDGTSTFRVSATPTPPPATPTTAAFNRAGYHIGKSRRKLSLLHASPAPSDARYSTRLTVRTTLTVASPSIIRIELTHPMVTPVPVVKEPLTPSAHRDRFPSKSTLKSGKNRHVGRTTSGTSFTLLRHNLICRLASAAPPKSISARRWSRAYQAAAGPDPFLCPKKCSMLAQ